MITPAQCRAARALLDLSQKQLAVESSVSLRSIHGFETGKRALQSLAMTAIERFFLGKGVLMISENGRIGVMIAITDTSEKATAIINLS